MKQFVYFPFDVFIQSLQQQLLRKPEGNEALLAYPGGGLQGVMGGANFVPPSSSMQLQQQPRKFFDLAQQHGVSQIREENQNKSQGVEQPVLNPVHQAYLQYAFQAAHQKAALGMQPQQQAKTGMVGPPSWKDQDARMGNLKMQDLISVQAANQASSSKKPAEHFARVEKQMEQGQQPISDQRSESKPPTMPTAVGQLLPGNFTRSMQPVQNQQGIQNMTNSQLTMAAQLQAMQAWALERNIDLSLPANANLMAQLIPLMQTRMVPPQKLTESNMGVQPSPVQGPKQQVTSPPVASENSPHGNSSSDVSGQSGSVKARQTVPPSPFGSNPNAAISNTNNTPVQQFSVQGRESQVPPRQTVVIGNGMSPMHPPQPSVNMSQGVDHPLHAKNTQSGQESLQMQYLRQLNRSSPQSVVPPNDGGLGNHFQSQGGPLPQAPQQRFGFTKQQLHVLKAQILAFRRLKVRKYACLFFYFISLL